MTLIAIFAFAAAVAFLILGVVSMTRGGEFDLSHAVPYMTGRLVMHGVAFVCILLAMLAAFH